MKLFSTCKFRECGGFPFSGHYKWSESGQYLPLLIEATTVLDKIKPLVDSVNALPELTCIDGRRLKIVYTIPTFTNDHSIIVESLLDALTWYANLANEADNQECENLADGYIKEAYNLLDQC